MAVEIYSTGELRKLKSNKGFYLVSAPVTDYIVSEGEQTLIPITSLTPPREEQIRWRNRMLDLFQPWSAKRK